MGGGNGQKAKMARERNMEKLKGQKGSQLEANKKAMSIQAISFVQNENNDELLVLMLLHLCNFNGRDCSASSLRSTVGDDSCGGNVDECSAFCDDVGVRRHVVATARGAAPLDLLGKLTKNSEFKLRTSEFKTRPDFLRRPGLVKCYMKQLISGLEHCHSNGVLHRDIKCSNLLIDNEGILKIADFGLASFFDPERKKPMTSRVVTLWYRPPELLLGATYYSVGVDLWSAGCIMAELLSGKPILRGQTEIDWVRQPLQQARPSVVVYAISEVLDTIRATLHAIGGDAALESFRSGCFGHFLDYRAGVVQKKAIHGLMSREVRVSDRVLEGRETWFQIHHSQLRFGPTEYSLVSGLRFGSTSIDLNADEHVVPQKFVFYRLFKGKRTTVKHLEDQFEARQAISGKGQGQYHFYGPIWALQLRVVSFVPSPEEMVTPYFRSMQLQAGAQSVRFVPSRSTNKKLIANAASYCSSSAVDDVGPSAQGTRAARTPQKVRQGTSRPSSRALRDEPDPDYIPDLRPPAEEAAEHTADPIHRESPPRAWGRKQSRRDRSQSSEEPSESFLQRVVAAIMPGV
ncbi:Protein kinase superfamily protein [Perilla frutescens var. hirtella]|nr:Protein kinase superfamily protein [Perilla frutescens var. hirtella]